MTRGVASSTLVADSDRENRETVEPRLEATGVDGAAVFRLVGVDTQMNYNPGVYPGLYCTFSGYCGWAYPIVYDLV